MKMPQKKNTRRRNIFKLQFFGVSPAAFMDNRIEILPQVMD
jgi:hypothetical protein